LENRKERSIQKNYMGGRIILNWILKIQNGRPWTGLIWQAAGSAEYGNEIAASTTSREFLE
jgi:hypothetical protein